MNEREVMGMSLAAVTVAAGMAMMLESNQEAATRPVQPAFTDSETAIQYLRCTHSHADTHTSTDCTLAARFADMDDCETHRVLDEISYPTNESHCIEE